jgi:hypothetical protein
VNSAEQWTVRYTIGFKIFAIAAGLLVLMAGATLLMVRMSRDLGNELEFFAETYLPSYAAIARANVRSVERALVLRRLVIASTDTTANAERRQALREQFAELGRRGEEEVALAEKEGANRRKQGLLLVSFNLAKLESHMTASRRILNDLRTLRRVLLSERQSAKSAVHTARQA